MPIKFGRPAGNRVDAKTLEVSIQKLLSHTLLIGRTGQGKTNAEKYIMKGILEESDNGTKAGFTYIDPDGNDIQSICSIIPEEMKDRVHILHFGNSYNPQGINILEIGKDPQDMSARVAGMLREVLTGEVGNRMDHWMRYGLMTLGNDPNQSILGFDPLFNDEKYRDQLVRKLKDPALQFFWSDNGAFKSIQPKLADIFAPIMQKLGPFLMYPPIRRVFGQSESTIKIGQIMQDGDILLIDLSALNHELKKMVGTILFHLFHAESVKRFEATEPEDRTPHFLFTNELSYYPTGILSILFAEGRKYGLGIVASLQTFDRISGHLASEVVNSVGTYLVFQSGIGDATRISKSLIDVEPSEVAKLSRFHFIVLTSDENWDVRQEVMKFDEIESIRHNSYNTLLAASDLRSGKSIVEVNKEISKYLGW